MNRRLPRPRELAPLVRFKRPTLDPKRRRLEAALTIDDLRRIAKRRTPRAAFDYTEGGGRGRDLDRAGRARRSATSSSTRGSCATSRRSTRAGTCSAGGPSCPFGIAPTGFTRLMHTEGEEAGAAAAAAAGIPFALSTMGTTSIEDVAAAGGPNGRHWFQLYMWKDRDRSMALVERAAAGRLRHPARHRRRAGGRRPAARHAQRHDDPAHAHAPDGPQRDPPPGAGGSTSSPPSRCRFASLDRWSGTVAELLDTMFDPTVDYRRPGLDQASSGRASSSSRACRRSRTPSGWSTSGSTPSRCPTTAAASSTGRRCRSTCCPRSCARWVGTPRCTSTPASVGGRHRRRGGARRPVHHDRPRLPLRPDGRRSRGRRPRHRDPARRGRPDHAAARRDLPRGARARATSPSCCGWCPVHRAAWPRPRPVPAQPDTSSAGICAGASTSANSPPATASIWASRSRKT